MLYDLKDKRILSELDFNAKLTTTSLAKKVRLSRQVVDYRLNRLKNQKTIYAFYTLIDPGMVGFSLFRIHLKLKNITEKEYSVFAHDLFENYPVFWIAFVFGSFDMIIDVFSKNANYFENLFSKILKKYKQIIQNYETQVILELNLYNYNYFLNSSRLRKKITLHKNVGNVILDEKNKQILTIIKNNSRLSFEEIGRMVNLTRNAVKNRIKNLEQKQVIKGYMFLVDFRHFNKQSFKILIRYDHSKINIEHSLLSFLKQKTGVLATLKLLGRWNLDIEIHTKDIKELQQFMMYLRNNFEIIQDYEILQIINDFGIAFYPRNL